jgi:hypothetical protein
MPSAPAARRELRKTGAANRIRLSAFVTVRADGRATVDCAKSLVDLRRNLLQPFLGTICLILIVSDLRLVPSGQ